MPKNIFARPYDLVTPDGKITHIEKRDSDSLRCKIEIENISSAFKGFEIDLHLVQFNIKSTFAQLGVDGIMLSCELLPKWSKALIEAELKAFTPIGVEFLKAIQVGTFVGKLFAADDRRIVRSTQYLSRILSKSDEEGRPLLILGEEYKSEEIITQPEKNRVIVKVPLLPGHWVYDEAIFGFLQTIAKGLQNKDTSFRQFLFLHQLHKDEPRKIPKDGFLMVKTMTMTIRTLFARVAHEELPKGYSHASSNLISPQKETLDIFEFHGNSNEEISHIPLEFYTLEPHREHFFFSDRDLLKESLEDPQKIFHAFETAPPKKAAAFLSKGGQFLQLTEKDWIVSDPLPDDPIIIPPSNRKEKANVDNFIRAQAIYPIVKAMQDGQITSQGILLTSYFPAPILKSFLLNERVTRCLKAIYFRTPSQKHGEFFSHDDRMLLQDLAKASVDIFWVDFNYKLVLKYVVRTDKDFGMFVPIDKEKAFKQATFFGLYGSRLLEFDFRGELIPLFQGLLQMQKEIDHPKLNPDISLVLSTGGGPGIMSMGNQIASELGILSCGHAVDFKKPHEENDDVEVMNPYIQAKMTYRLEHLIVRQSEFMLDFPIFFYGGVGTDFELELELLRTQVGSKTEAPILLFGSPEYWEQKITPKFQINRAYGTIRGTEWISNTLFCVQNHKQALSIYYKYFTKRLFLGKDYKPAPKGFVIVDGTD
ncbi:MAG: hypothetical protein JSR76_05550 [Verrucomicrobia bacterium]|nr:hypothetical protein [Verrucomicrobiota bacterium]